jgi:hypothetical protein
VKNGTIMKGDSQLCSNSSRPGNFEHRLVDQSGAAATRTSDIGHYETPASIDAAALSYSGALRSKSGY